MQLLLSSQLPILGREEEYSKDRKLFQKDVEMLLVNGFPKANISEGAIIQKYK